MIKSFKNKSLAKLFLTGEDKGVKPEHSDKIRRVLAILDEITEMIDVNFSSDDLYKLKSKTLNTLISRDRMEMYNPPHPGEILLEEYIIPFGFTISSFATKIKTSRKNLSAIVNQRVAISPEMALKLEKELGTPPEIWLKLQLKHDLWVAKNKRA